MLSLRDQRCRALSFLLRLSLLIAARWLLLVQHRGRVNLVENPASSYQAVHCGLDTVRSAVSGSC